VIDKPLPNDNRAKIGRAKFVLLVEIYYFINLKFISMLKKFRKVKT